MAELERLQGELKNLDPAALPPELRNLPPDGGLPGLGAPGGLLPGLGGGGLPKPPGGGRGGFPGFPFKKK
jgi:signal recognition particle subunit SRP54